MDAVKELASKAGMDVPAPDPKAKERADRAASLTDVMAEVAKWYAEQLQGVAGAEAREYLKRRGIDPETVARFGLGLAPDSRNALEARPRQARRGQADRDGHADQAEEAGKDSYDRFRGRLMIPIRDPRGRVIAFGGRILGRASPNTSIPPTRPLFDKGRTLYNIDRAGPASRAARRLIVVEGYMDVIALDRAGIAEAVAPNGTAVTEAPARAHVAARPLADPVLRRRQRRAQGRGPRRLARPAPTSRPDRTLRFVELPAGQDPDNVVDAGGRRRSKPCWPLPSRSTPACGGTSPKRSR